MKDFARGCMRTYLILKEKAVRFNADAEIQGLLAELGKDDPALAAFGGKYTPEKMKALKDYSFDTQALAKVSYGYEKLDQLTNEILLGVR